ncbi:hypothetical protein [Planktothrix sp. FACHB-1355]|nr:hypothetical protein [Planktothrix sp. FACHB-1355]
MIKFSNENFLVANFASGIHFTFDEGIVPIGEGVVEEIVEY